MSPSGKRQLVVPCACAGSCAVVLVTDWEMFSNEPEECFVEFYEHFRAKGLRQRVGVAWKVLRGKDPWGHGVCLEAPEVAQFRNFFNEIAPEGG